MTEQENPETQKPTEPPEEQPSGDSIPPTAEAASLSDDEVTKEIKVDVPESQMEDHPAPPDENLTPDPNEPGSDWVNESELDSGRAPDPNPPGADEQIPDRHPTGEPDATGGWWGDVPFTPMEALKDDDETQPVHLGANPDGVTRVSRVPGPGEPQSEPLVGEDLSKAATRAISAQPGSAETGDDMPTLPPVNAPHGWVPENPNLPKSVSEVDDQATRVTSAAYHAAPRPANAGRPSHEKGRRPSEMKRPEKPKENGKKGNGKKKKGCFARSLMILGFLIILALLVAGSIGIYQYFFFFAGCQ